MELALHIGIIMPLRKTIFVTSEIYHVYNRSVGNEQLFTSLLHLRRALEIVDFYRYNQRLRLSHVKELPKNLKLEYMEQMTHEKALVAIYAFSFMPNHFHLLVKQLQENGISKFMRIFQDSYGKFFNLKYDRHGALVQHPFSAKRIETEEQFLHILRYTHLNHVTAYLINADQLATYPFTSFPYYVNNEEKNSFVETRFALSMFPSVEAFTEFTLDQADYQRTLAEIKHLIID